MSERPKIVVPRPAPDGESANPRAREYSRRHSAGAVSNQYGEPTQQFFCGLWSSSAGKWRVRYTEHEFCLLIEGRVRLESAGGERHDLRAGDAFVVPAGFEGIWEVVRALQEVVRDLRGERGT